MLLLVEEILLYLQEVTFTASEYSFLRPHFIIYLLY